MSRCSVKGRDVSRREVFRSYTAGRFFSKGCASVGTGVKVGGYVGREGMGCRGAFESHSFLFFTVKLCYTGHVSTARRIVIPRGNAVSVGVPLYGSEEDSYDAEAARPISVGLVVHTLRGINVGGTLIGPCRFGSGTSVVVSYTRSSYGERVLRILDPLSYSYTGHSRGH